MMDALCQTFVGYYNKEGNLHKAGDLILHFEENREKNLEFECHNLASPCILQRTKNIEFLDKSLKYSTKILER
jgi:hypothetical protein